MTPGSGEKTEWKELFDEKTNKYYYWDAVKNSVMWTIPNSKWRKFKDPTTGNLFYVHGSEPNNRSWTVPPELIGSPWVGGPPSPPNIPPSPPSHPPLSGLAPNPLALAAAKRAAKLGQKSLDPPTIEVTNKTPVPVPPPTGGQSPNSTSTVFFPKSVSPTPPPFPPSDQPTSPTSPWQAKRPPPIQASTSTEGGYIKSVQPTPPPPLPTLDPSSPTKPIPIPPPSPKSPEKQRGLLHSQLTAGGLKPPISPSPPPSSFLQISRTPSPPSGTSYLSNSPPKVPPLSSSISPFGSSQSSFFSQSSSSPTSSSFPTPNPLSSSGSTPSPSNSSHFPPPSPPQINVMVGSVTPPSPSPPLPRVPSSPLSLPRTVNSMKPTTSPLKSGGLAAVPETQRAPSPTPPKLFLPTSEKSPLQSSPPHNMRSTPTSRGGGTMSRSSASPRSKNSFDGEDEEEGVDQFLDDRPLSTSGQSRSWGDKSDTARPASPLNSGSLTTDEVYEKEGWVWKKCPAGLRGFRVWQKRWFVIDAKTISYYKKKGEKKATGSLVLQDIAKCDYLPKKRMGDRIDIKVKRSKRVYSLHTSSVDEARSWWTVINNATKRAKAGGGGSLPDPSRQSTDFELSKLPPLLLMFAKAKFGKGIHQDVRSIPREHQKEIKEQMEKHFFDSEKYTLQWLLEHVMNPEKGQWIWDSRSDREVLSQEDETKRREGELKEEVLYASCGEKDCKIPPLGQARLCVYHQNVRHIPPEKMTTEDRLIEMLRSPDFFRHLQKVFDNEEEEAHGLAIRVLWILNHGLYDRKEANKQFDAYVTILCNAEKFNLEISNALLSILLTDPKEIHKNEELRVAFYNPVINESVWKPIFGCLCGSTFGLRKTALEDITTVLHDNLENCRSLQRINNWQDCIYAVMTDIEKTRKNEDETVKTAFAYCINVLTMVHFENFMQTEGDQFKVLMSQSLEALHRFGGPCIEGATVASILLGSLCSKLASNKKLFSLSDFSSKEWANLKKLQKVAKKFIFITAYWNKDIYSYLEEEDQKQNEGKQAPILSPIRPQARPQTDCKYILKRDRNKVTKAFTDELTPPEQKDYGLHWSEEGACVDVLLCEKMLGLFRALNIHEYDPSLKPNMLDTEKTFLRNGSRDYKFWEDAKRFCETVRVQDIEELHLTTHRRVSHWAREFFEKQKNKSDRKSILKEMASKVNRQLEGTSTMYGGSTTTLYTQ